MNRLFFFILFSSPAFAIVTPPQMPQMYDPYTTMGMDPICMLAYQAGVEGQGRPLSVSESLKKAKKEQEELRDKLKDLAKELKQEVLRERMTCFGNPGADSPKPCVPSNTVSNSSITDAVKNHFSGKGDPQDCSGAPGASGVSFFNKEHAVMYAQLPFLLIAPLQASANTGGQSEQGVKKAANRTAEEDKGSGFSFGDFFGNSRILGIRADNSAAETSIRVERDDNLKVKPLETASAKGIAAPGAVMASGGGSVTPNSVTAEAPEEIDGENAASGDSNTDETEAADAGGTDTADEGTTEVEVTEGRVLAGRDPSDSESCRCPPGSGPYDNGTCQIRCSGNRSCPAGNAWRRSTEVQALCVAGCSSVEDLERVSCERGSAKPEPAPSATPSWEWCGKTPRDDGNGDENCRCAYKRYFEDDRKIDEDGFCSDRVFIREGSDDDEIDDIEEECEDILEEMEDIGEDLMVLKEEISELKREERNENRLRRKCERAQGRLARGRISEMPDECTSNSATEAKGFCTDCFNKVVESFYPKPSTWEKILNVATPLIGTGLALHGINKSNRLRARQGYAVDNSAAMGLAWPYATAMLYGGALTGRGRNSLSCSPTANHNPYGSIFGNILGNLGIGANASAYGQFGSYGAGPGLFPQANFNAYAQLNPYGAGPGLFPQGNFNAYAQVNPYGAGPGLFPQGNFNAYAQVNPYGAGPGLFPQGNFNAYAQLNPYGSGPGLFPQGNFNAYAQLNPYGAGANMGIHGGLHGGLHGAGLTGANAAYLEMYQKQQAIQMEYQQMILERSQSKQRALSRLYEEMNRLRLQAYDIQYGAGGFVNHGASHIGAGSSTGTYPSGDGSGH